MRLRDYKAISHDKKLTCHHKITGREKARQLKKYELAL